MKKLSFFFATAFLTLLLSQNTTAQTLPDYLPAEGLVAWWPFNGNANDESGNGNNGTVNGATLTTDRFGNPNSAYDFDGVTNFIETPNLSAVEGVTEMTWSVWVLPRTYGSISHVIDNSVYGQQYNRMKMSIGNYSCLNNSLRMAINNAQYEAAFTDSILSTNSLFHFVVVYKGNEATNELKLRLYVNGIEQVSNYQNLNVCTPVSMPSQTQGTGVPWKIGGTTSTSHFDGIIDDIGIWNRALTPEEVTALYTGVPYVAPCADPTACNFEQEGECVYAEPNLDCEGNCLNDTDGDGVCDENEVAGCTHPSACNYVAEATDDDGSCVFAESGFDCDGNCLNDDNQNGVCDDQEVYGCTYADAINFDETASVDDGSCLFTCKGDFDNNGLVDSNDLLSFLAAFGYSCSDAGCDDEAACNYDPEALYSDGSCTYPEEFFNCEGAPVNDVDGDGIPDELEVPGCTDPEAGNYNPEATDDDGSCLYGLALSPWLNQDLEYNSITDIEGNSYATIVIGNQEWMAENLRTSTYANGELIPNITSDLQWSVLDFGAWCYYENNPDYESPNGKLYNWFAAVDVRNVCPSGWHVPSLADYQELITTLGGAANAGGLLKTAGFDFWPNGNVGGSNLSGFSALPTGVRIAIGPAVFEDGGFRTSWWNTSEMSFSTGRPISVKWDDASASEANETKKAGLPIRCLRD